MLGQEQNLPPLLRSLLSPSAILGDRGPQVAALQRDLTTAGFSVQGTGTYDEVTRAAVEAFQRRVGLTPTGVVGARTLAALARAVEAAKAKAAQAGVGLALMSPILVVAAGIVALVALGAVPKRRRGLGQVVTTEPLWRAVGIYPDEGVEVANQRTGETRVVSFQTASSWVRHGRLEPITEEQIEGCDCAPKARKYGLVASKEGLGIRMAFPVKQWFARIRGIGRVGPMRARSESEAKKQFRFRHGHWPSEVWQA